ncbi:MAG TPA: hypothetical protein VGF38_21645 [Ktedonobacterales bacterium]
MVSLTDDAPLAVGRTWSAENYAARDAQLAALGVRSFRKRRPSLPS